MLGTAIPIIYQLAFVLFGSEYNVFSGIVSKQDFWYTFDHSLPGPDAVTIVIHN
jgi:hypothetical protein